MNLFQKIAKNSGAMLGADWLNKAAMFFLIVYAARFLGTQKFGMFSFVMAFVELFAVFYDLGLGMLIIREVAGDKSKTAAYLTNSLFIKLLSSLVLFLIIFSISRVTGNAKEVQRLLVIYVLAQTLSSFSAVFASLFTAWERMELVALANSVRSILLLGLGIAVLHLGYGLEGLFKIFLGVNGIQLLYWLLLTSRNRIFRPQWSPQFSSWRDILQKAWPFAFLVLFIQIYFRIDITMLQYMKGAVDVGIYNAAYKLFTLGLSLPWVVNQALFPTLSSLDSSAPERLRETYSVVIKYSIIVSLPLSVGGFLFAPKIISLFFGGEYSKAASVLKILFLLLLPCSVASFTNCILTVKNPKITMAIAGGVMTPLNIVLNLLLIPKFSYYGAAAATLVTEIIGAVLSLYYNFRLVSGLKLNPEQLLTKPVLAALAMGILIYLINSLVMIPVCVLVYFSILIVLNGISREERRYLLKSLGLI
ncbi:MAG: flippase [Candidatus Zixiibacteriota bacterium]